MSGLHPENTEEETQVTTVEQSRTVTVPEAVVTQILPPATGRTNEQSFLWNCICNLEENVLWLAKDGVTCTIVTNGEVILMHQKMVPDQSRPIIWVTFTILESKKHCSIGHVCSSACIQLSWYSLIFLVEGIPTTSSSATINLPQRQEALNPEEESSVRALYTAFMPQHLQVKTHVQACCDWNNFLLFDYFKQIKFSFQCFKSVIIIQPWIN